MDFKEIKRFLEQKAIEYYNNHKSCFETWQEGNIKKIWLDKDSNLCIEYESGRYWHYNESGEWW